MSSKRTIASFLILCMVIHLIGCQTTKILTSENLYFHKTRDEIISVTSVDGDTTILKTDYLQPYSRYVQNDTLFCVVVNINKPRHERLDTIKYPVSEIECIEISRFWTDGTYALIIFGGIFLGGVVVYGLYALLEGLPGQDY